MFDLLPSLKNLCITSFSEDAFADSTLLCLPPLESLRLENLPGVTDRGLVQYTSRPESRSLKSFVLVERLRGVGLRAEIGYDEKSLRSQLRRANRLGAAFTVMLGERELVAGKVSLKDMQGGEQAEIPLAQVISYVQERLQKSPE